MLIGLIALSILAYRAFQHRGLTYTFLVLWLIGVGSGELLYFVVRYG